MMTTNLFKQTAGRNGRRGAELGGIVLTGLAAMLLTGCSSLLPIQPAQVDARFNLAAALLRARRTADALRQYEEVLRYAPNDAAAHAEAGNILAHTGRLPEAIAHYEAALRLQPDFTIARDELARLRAAAGAGRP